LEGRWEVIQKKPFQVIVDFAHTPNALEKALEVARTQIDSDHDVILVFGCAGKRDVNKRPMMGEISGRLANKVILTAEDPRGESVEEINRQIAEGLRNSGKRVNKELFGVLDRALAIKKAITLARPGDLVLITGKGHEKSMNIDGKNEISWSDQDIVKRVLSS
jgi:UDP-N-acetylmuramoyl-L-alanyl-D-glutamate--2,6-diaminopimelate ligase